MMRYWTERFAPGLFVPAAAGIALAAQAGSGVSGRSWTIASLLALLLLAQFRLWDDLADRERDRDAHPDRLLVRTTRIGPFIATCAGLALVNVILLAAWRGAFAAAGLLILDVAALAYYTWRPGHRTAVSDLLLLAKYPMFVVLLASPATRPLAHVAVAAVAIYAAACAFEIRHDASSGLSSSVAQWISERGARLARRDDREYSNVFEGGATPPDGMPRPKAAVRMTRTGH